jgi:hypothetical protein
MPYALKANNGSFAVINSQTGDVKAKRTTKARGKKQIKLLEAVDHGWKPTGKGAPVSYQEMIPKPMGMGAAIGPGANPIDIRMDHNVVSTTGGRGMLPVGTKTSFHVSQDILHPKYPYLPSMDQSYAQK